MKTRLLTLAFGALCSLLFASNAAAQGCALILTPHYSQYVNRSLDSSNNIYQTVELDGYADVGSSASCHMSTAVHSPRIYNVTGSQGGWSTGPGGCPSCYVSYSTAVNIIGEPGVDYPYSTDSDMFCTVAGTFWSTGGNGFIHIGVTNFILESWDTNNCYYQMFCPNGNTAASCPAATFVDTDGMNAIPACNTLNYAWVEHLVVDGVCLPVGVTFFGNTPKNCQ